jgi:hypothetical protein
VVIADGLNRRALVGAFLLPWAQEVPGSNPGAPTKNIPPIFLSLSKAFFHPKLSCGIPIHRRSEFAANSIPETCRTAPA